MKKVSGRMARRTSRSSWYLKPEAEKGFTIVEILIVLAIGSLILLILFLVVPTAQRSVRNYDRKNAVDYIMSQMDSYKADHGYFPIEAPQPDVDDRVSFVNSLSTGPAAAYRIRYTDDGPNHAYPYAGVDAPADLDDALDEISISPGHICNRDGSGPGDPDFPIKSTGTWGTDYKSYAVFTLLEKAPIYCQDNDLGQHPDDDPNARLFQNTPQVIGSSVRSVFGIYRSPTIGGL